MYWKAGNQCISMFISIYSYRQCNYLYRRHTLDWILTLKAPCKICSRQHVEFFIYYYLFFRENKSWHFMWMKCQSNLWKNKSKIVFYCSCVGILRHVNPCGSFCVISQSRKERDSRRWKRGSGKKKEQEWKGKNRRNKRHSPIPLSDTRIASLGQL